MSENVFAADDFTEEEIYDYIDQRLNFYEGYASAKDATKADHQTSLTLWKTFIWLEQAGYDFWDQCWHESVRRFLWERSVGWNTIAEDEWETFDREDDLILPKHMGRRMQFHVRNRMLGVLGLDWLPESEYERIKDITATITPFANDRAIPEGLAPNLNGLVATFPSAEEEIFKASRLNFHIFLTEISLCNDNVVEQFEDNYTPNGVYDYLHYEATYDKCYWLLISNHCDIYFYSIYGSYGDYWLCQITRKFRLWMKSKYLSEFSEGGR